MTTTTSKSRGRRGTRHSPRIPPFISCSTHVRCLSTHTRSSLSLDANRSLCDARISPSGIRPASPPQRFSDAVCVTPFIHLYFHVGHCRALVLCPVHNSLSLPLELPVALRCLATSQESTGCRTVISHERFRGGACREGSLPTRRRRVLTFSRYSGAGSIRMTRRDHRSRLGGVFRSPPALLMLLAPALPGVREKFCGRKLFFGKISLGKRYTVGSRWQ